jgi:hypothetical protein
VQKLAGTSDPGQISLFQGRICTISWISSCGVAPTFSKSSKAFGLVPLLLIASRSSLLVQIVWIVYIPGILVSFSKNDLSSPGGKAVLSFLKDLYPLSNCSLRFSGTSAFTNVATFMEILEFVEHINLRSLVNARRKPK